KLADNHSQLARVGHQPAAWIASWTTIWSYCCIPRTDPREIHTFGCPDRSGVESTAGRESEIMAVIKVERGVPNGIELDLHQGGSVGEYDDQIRVSDHAGAARS